MSGALSLAELLSFPHRDHNGDPYHYVVMNGRTGGTRRGCPASGISRVRDSEYFRDSNHRTLREVGVPSHDDDSGPFSRRGDSGALIVGTAGKAAALLARLTGSESVWTGSCDITYATPFVWVFETVI